MRRVAALLYGLVSYALFLGVFLYAIGFVDDLLVPKSVSSGAPGPLVPSLVVDALLLTLFALQHSVMARPAFKRVWTRVVPWAVERSTYVLFASLVLALLFWQWRPIAGTVWTVEQPAAAVALTVLGWLGWATILASTFMIDHFHLFGLKQVGAFFGRRKLSEPRFMTPLLYRLVRHPLMLGFLVAFWATPVMTASRLLFVLASTGYILVAVRFEERDLVAVFGERYQSYRKRVRAFVPLPRLGHGAPAGRAVTEGD